MAQGTLYLTGSGLLDIPLAATPLSVTAAFTGEFLNEHTVCGPQPQAAGDNDSLTSEAVVVDGHDFLRISWSVRDARKAAWSTT